MTPWLATYATVQTTPVPLPFPIVDQSGMSAGDLAAWASFGATLLLLLFTWRTVRSNRTMADKAIESADAAREAAEASSETAAIANAQVPIQFVGDVTVGSYLPPYTPTAGVSPEPVGVTFWLDMRVEGAAVSVHRVVLVEYPCTRGVTESIPTVMSRSKNVPPAFFWGFHSPDRGRYPVAIIPGDDYLFEMGCEIHLPPDAVRKFIAVNRIVVEYSFEGSNRRRLARVQLPNAAGNWPRVGAAITELPDTLTSDLPWEAQLRANKNACKGAAYWLGMDEAREENDVPDAGDTQPGATPVPSGRLRIRSLLDWLGEPS